MTSSLDDRHFAVRNIFRFFAYDHLPEDLQPVSRECHDLALRMIESLPDSAQLANGLWDLLRAKDCFVRAALPEPT